MTTFNIKVTKAKQALEVVWEELPDAIKLRIIEEGLGKLLNAATAKVTAKSSESPESMASQALGLAQKKLDSLKKGELRAKVSRDGKVSGVVMTEARRLAKNIIKQQIKAANKKILDYEAKAITEAANVYLTNHPELVAAAQASIDAAKGLATQAGVDVSAIPVSEAKKAKRIAKNAEARAATAAKDAGKPGPQKSATKMRQVPQRKPADASTGVSA